MSTRRKVGIMGGTFNPIHTGHLIMAEHAYDSFGLDEILFIPTGNSYMKSDVLDKETRAKMVSLSIEDNPKFAMSDIEISKDTPSYSFETIRELKQLNPGNDYYFIVGEDSLRSMKDWVHPEKIFSEITVLVARRPYVSIDKLMDVIEFYESTYNADIQVIEMNNIDISSTEIRNRVSEGKSIKYMVHPKVLDFIQSHNLYS